MLKKIGILVFACICFVSSNAQDGVDSVIIVNELSKKCLECHNNKHYTVYDEAVELNVRKLMNPYLVIDSSRYLIGVHGTFSCDDCHNPDYETYPHNADLKKEMKYSCLDCHGEDPEYAHLHFDEIGEQVNQSVHIEAFGASFKCESCHSPHFYSLKASAGEYSIKDIVANNNEMCMNCHNDNDSYMLFSENESPVLVESHDWLPNQLLHFRSVRCIDCHTPSNDTMMVSHKILAKDQAVKNCVECHSTNSILQSQLFKYNAKTSHATRGFYNSVLLNESYVIGANRNKYLNNISILIFLLTIGGITIHSLVRIIKK